MWMLFYNLTFVIVMNKDILRLAIPNIISNITVPLLGMVDMFIVGHLDSEYYIGAIALAAMIFNAIYWSFSFLRMGTSGFTAQAYGAKDWQEGTNILLRALMVAMAAGILIIILQQAIAYIGFTLVDREPELKTFALTYFHIYIWAAPAILGMYAFNGWFIGMQNAKTPMFISIGINVVNIGLSFIFVYGLGMQIEGVALASVLAQYSGFLASLIICNIQYKNLKQYINLKILANLQSFIPFFKVNSNIFIRTMALVTVTTFFMSASAKLGNDILSVNALMMQLFILFSFIMDGFAYAAEALTGKLIGAGKKSELKALVKRLFIWGGIIVVIFTLIYGVFTDQILSFLTDKQNIVELSKEYQFWALLIPVAGFSAFLWDGIFIGATASRQMRNSMLIASASFFVIYFSFNTFFLNNILWFAFIVYLALRGIIQYFMAPTILNESR